MHIALLGDSVFDNGAYTNGEPDVATHLRGLVGEGIRVTLLARDGAMTTDMRGQVDRIAGTVTNLVLSVGGNDALANAGLLAMPIDSTGTTLDLFAALMSEFETSYRHVLEALEGKGRRLTVCTIYNGNLERGEATRAKLALRMFNDVIVTAATSVGADVIDLRAVCTASKHFANPIEPSGLGGLRIAEAIAHVQQWEPSAVTRLYQRRD
ncbi:MAG: SGNH/GDSL hydrolase family protein [Polyangiaceae bacterium]|nr:SGNH/GDSL hydrolase family protein [Polyangiaceae bacterium]